MRARLNWRLLSLSSAKCLFTASACKPSVISSTVAASAALQTEQGATAGLLTQPQPIGVVLADPAAVVATGARLRLHHDIPSGRFIAGDVRFFTLIQCVDRPARYGEPLIHAFTAHQAACRNSSGRSRPRSKSLRMMPRSILRDGSFAGAAAMAGDRRARSSAHQVELHFLIKLPAVEAVEVGDAVDAEQHRFAVQNEGVRPVTQARPRQ
jgi:hypothetical protein